MKPRKPIVWIGHFRGCSGFAVATREYFLALKPHVEDLQLAPLAVLEDDDPFKAFQAPLPLDDENVFKVVNHLPITDPEADAYLSVCEYDRIDDEWVECLDQAQVIMTQSSFCRDVFARQVNDPSKIHLVPYILPREFTPRGKALRLVDNDEDTFLFGSIFEWIPRKAPEHLIRAFVQEFAPEEPVRLLLRSFHPNGLPISSLVNKISRDPRIIVIDRVIDDLPAFYRGLDAYILCSAGEGWSQTHTEAMACGVPAIASRHGGNLDFMDDSNSFLVDVEDWSPVPGMESFHWKLPVIDSIQEVMRHVYEHRDSPSTREKVRHALERCADFTREKVAPKILRALRPFFE